MLTRAVVAYSYRFTCTCMIIVRRSSTVERSGLPSISEVELVGVDDARRRPSSRSNWSRRDMAGECCAAAATVERRRRGPSEMCDDDAPSRWSPVVSWYDRSLPGGRRLQRALVPAWPGRSRRAAAAAEMSRVRSR